MDWAAIWSWVERHATGLGVVIPAVVALSGAIAWFFSRDKKPNMQITQASQNGGQGVQAGTIHGGVHHGTSVDVNQIITALAEANRKIGNLEESKRQLENKLDETQTSKEALAKAVAALQEQARLSAQPVPFTHALKELRAGRPEEAETLFRKILEERNAVGVALYNEAAEAAKNLGAIAFYHDTEKALRAYTQATKLNPNDEESWNQLGELKFRIGDLAGAEKALERVLELGNSANNHDVIATAINNLGTIYWQRGELGRAEEMYRKALALNEKLGRKEGMASVYGNLGLVAQTRGDAGQAEEMHRKALALNEELGRKKGVAIAYSNLGIAYQMQGNLGQAEETYRKALVLNEKLGRKEGLAADYGNLGIVYVERGDTKQAEEAFLKALELNEGLGRKTGVAHGYVGLGVVAEARGDLEQAENMFRKALELEEELGSKAGRANIYSHLGSLLATKGQKDEGCRMLADSWRIYCELGATKNAEKIEARMHELGYPATQFLPPSL